MASLLFSCTAIAADEFWTSDWWAYSGDRFELFSDLPAEQIDQKVADLHRFHEVVTSTIGARSSAARYRNSIYLLAERGDLSRMLGRHAALGVTRHAGDVSHVLSTHGTFGGRQGNTGRILFHEYVHCLLREGPGQVIPRWYKEGLADFLSTTQLRADSAVIGKDLSVRLRTVRSSRLATRLAAVLQNDDVADLPPHLIAEYYAWSWALTHYLRLGRGRADADVNAEFDRYFDLLGGGHDRIAAFSTAFGASVAETQRAVLRYVKRGHRRTVSQPLSQSDVPRYARAPITPFDAAYRLGFLTMPINPELARQMFDTALRLQPNSAHAIASKVASVQLGALADAGHPIDRPALLAVAGNWRQAHDLAAELRQACAADQPAASCARRFEQARIAERELLTSHTHHLNRPAAEPTHPRPSDAIALAASDATAPNGELSRRRPAP